MRCRELAYRLYCHRVGPVRLLPLGVRHAPPSLRRDALLLSDPVERATPTQVQRHARATVGVDVADSLSAGRRFSGTPRNTGALILRGGHAGRVEARLRSLRDGSFAERAGRRHQLRRVCELERRHGRLRDRRSGRVWIGTVGNLRRHLCLLFWREAQFKRSHLQRREAVVEGAHEQQAHASAKQRQQDPFGGRVLGRRARHRGRCRRRRRYR